MSTPQHCSWRCRLEFRDTAKDFLCTCIGKGENTKFINGFWHPKGRLCDWVPKECLKIICPNKKSLVDGFIRDDGLDIPSCTHTSDCTISSLLQQMEVDVTKNDRMMWKVLIQVNSL